MLNKFIANIFVSSALLIITFPASAINLVPGVLKFTSNNPELEQTSGTFQFDKDNSFIVEGEQVFGVSDINLTTPFRTKYTSRQILKSTYDYETNTTTIPEPLTMLGTATAIAFGVGFKRKLSKSKKK